MEIKTKYPKCETLAVECDFSQIGSLEEYRALVNDNLASLDIGILCLNAGLTNMGKVG